jgi:protein AaeX
VAFTEIDLFGVYVAPMSLMMLAAWLITAVLRSVIGHLGLLRFTWHPALFLFSVHIMVLACITLARAR